MRQRGGSDGMNGRRELAVFQADRAWRNRHGGNASAALRQPVTGGAALVGTVAAGLGEDGAGAVTREPALQAEDRGGVNRPHRQLSVYHHIYYRLLFLWPDAK